VPCSELSKLREEARRTREQLSQKVRRAKEFPTAHHHNGKTDYEPFLKHRLAQMESDIRRHLEKHQCE